MELSKRLQAVANLVSDNLSVADIGTDHGYIPIYLIESGKSSRVIAMDINEGPLLCAEKHIMEHGLVDRVQIRLSDGVRALEPKECDSVIIAGMGGNLVIKIIEEGTEIFRDLTEFILQPQSEISKVRQYLWEHGYRIVKEDIVLEEGKFYPMMKVMKGSVTEYNKMELHYGRLLLEEKHPILKVFLEKEVKTKEKILASLEHKTGAHIEVRKKELLEELSEAKEALRVCL